MILPRQLTLFGQVPVDDEFAVAQIVQHRPKIGGIPVNEVGTRLIFHALQGLTAVLAAAVAPSVFITGGIHQPPQEGATSLAQGRPRCGEVAASHVQRHPVRGRRSGHDAVFLLGGRRGGHGLQPKGGAAVAERENGF